MATLRERHHGHEGLGVVGPSQNGRPPPSAPRRDVIDDDYQLQSDIETFERLTGKAIPSQDSPPSLGDEMEMEDMERSI